MRNAALVLTMPVCTLPWLRCRRAAESQPTSASYIDMTVSAMRQFGIVVTSPEGAPNVFQVPRGGYCMAGDAGAPLGGCLVVEPDASSATYFAAVAALTGRTVTLLGVGSSSTQGACKSVSASGWPSSTVRLPLVPGSAFDSPFSRALLRCCRQGTLLFQCRYCSPWAAP